MELKKIATFHCPLAEKFGIPRQSGLAPSLKGRIVFEPEYRSAEAFRGLEAFSHLWLIWGFSANKHKAESLSVRPPRLGGNKRVGVFATRSPFRPNPIGMSAVKIESLEPYAPQGPEIHVLGADLMDGTPIYDIKPYIRYADSIPEAVCGFVDENPWEELKISNPEILRDSFAAEETEALTDILRQDPRPQYSCDSEKVYGVSFSGRNIRFKVVGSTLTIISLD